MHLTCGCPEMYLYSESDRWRENTGKLNALGVHILSKSWWVPYVQLSSHDCWLGVPRTHWANLRTRNVNMYEQPQSQFEFRSLFFG